MYFLYSVLIRLYGISILIASFFNKKAKRFIEGRKNQNLTEVNQLLEHWRQNKIYWIHISSYGEFEMSRPIIKALQEDSTNKFVISFFSPSGFDQVQLNKNDFIKLYLPIDHYASQKELVEIINPYKVIFIKYDFWFNLLRTLREKSIPYYFTSIHLNKDHYLLKTVMRPFLNLISNSTRLYCHNERSISTLEDHNINNTTLLGDSRIAQVFQNKNDELKVIEWAKDQRIISFGSILNDEYEMVCGFINKSKGWNVIVAPHEVQSENIDLLTSKLNEQVSYYSKSNQVPGRILLVDTMGDLKYLYRESKVAYVGGGFDKGPHNVLEPMVYGIPTIIGPNLRKFPMAKYLSEQSLLTVLSSPHELSQGITKSLKIESKNITSKMLELQDDFEIGFNKMIEDLK